MKKVGCLYRVSSKKQTYNNDIPMQRDSCIKFINKQTDWKFEREYIETGVSGYKISANDRDVLQDIKKDVLKNKIDILLVFLFDRIGRKEEETPFVVEWLIKNGIEVWSVNEGQRVIENRTDKLINYLTYWQAEGESEKISIRAFERRVQLIKKGVYLGNYPPYGYDLIDSDEITKIGKIRRILKINPEEAKIVNLIFSLVIDYNYGIDKIAVYLNKHNYRRRKAGTKWDNTEVLDILRNPIYKGFVSFGKRTRRKDVYRRNKREDWILADKPNPDIIIISEPRWNKANEILDSRRRIGIRQLRLLSGLTRCGYCKDFITPKGRNKYTYFVCKGKQKTGFCEYNANYRVDILENIINVEVKSYLDNLAKVDLKEIIINKRKDKYNNQSKLKTLNKKISNTENKIQELKKEIVTCLLAGDENYKSSLSKKIEEQNNKLKVLLKEKEKLDDYIHNMNTEINDINECIPNWYKEYENAALEDKRAIINKLIDKIYLYNNKIEIKVKYPIDNYIIKGYKKDG